MTITNENLVGTASTEFDSEQIADLIRELSPNREGVELGIALIGLDEFYRDLAGPLKLPVGQEIQSVAAVRNSRCLQVGLISVGGYTGLHDLFVTDGYRPFSEPTICLLGKLSYCEERNRVVRFRPDLPDLRTKITG